MTNMRNGLIFRFRASAALAFCTSVTLLMTPGCDKHPTRVPVSGHVLIDGEPLKYGSVVFVPDGGRSSMGVLDQQGHFTLTCFTSNDGALLGSHKVQVMASEVVDDYTTHFHAPQKYAGLATSGITKEITGPTDSVVIELTWKGDAHGKPYTQNFPRGSGASGDVESNSLFKKK